MRLEPGKREYPAMLNGAQIVGGYLFMDYAADVRLNLLPCAEFRKLFDEKNEVGIPTYMAVDKGGSMILFYPAPEYEMDFQPKYVDPGR